MGLQKRKKKKNISAAGLFCCGLDKLFREISFWFKLVACCVVAVNHLENKHVQSLLIRENGGREQQPSRRRFWLKKKKHLSFMISLYFTHSI